MQARGARERVLLTLARQRRALAIRTVAWLAEVAPSTAKRVGDELVCQGRARHRRAASRELLLELTPATRAQLRIAYGPQRRLAPDQQIARLRRLAARGAPIYVGDGSEWKAYGIRVKAPFVMLPVRWRDLFDVTVPTVFVRGSRVLELHRLTENDWFIALLQLEPHRAAGMLRQMREAPTFQRTRQKLKRRLRQEGLVREAEAVGLPADARRRATPGASRSARRP